MSDVPEVPDAKTLREQAKKIAEQRRQEARARKRKCALCGTEETERTPFFAHPDGIGPTCKEPGLCEHYRAHTARGGIR